MLKFSTWIYKTILIFIFFSAVSCTKIVNIPLPPIESKPVVYSVIANERAIQLYFDKSFGILEYVDSGQMYSSEATIKLYVNNQYKERLSWYYGYFQSNFIPKPRDTLFVEILPEFSSDTLYASTYIPQFVNIDTAWFTDSVYKDRDGVYYSRVNLGFKDMKDIKNYYEIFIRAKCCVDEKPVFENIQSYYSDNPVIINEGLIGSIGQIENDVLSDNQPVSVIFSDTLFDGEEINIDITFLRPCEYVTGQPEHHSFSLSVYLSNVTQSYYKYRKTVFLHLNGQQSYFWDGYTEPIDMFSNVKGGYGVFAGYTPDSVIFNIP